MMPEIDENSPIFELDLSSFEDRLIKTFSSHEPFPIRAIERVLKEMIFEKVVDCACQFNHLISTQVKIHSLYNKENKSLFRLSNENIDVWYVEIITKWKKAIGFKSITINIKGLKLLPIKYFDGDKTQKNFLKELKTQTNINTTLNHLEIPKDMIRRVFYKTQKLQNFLIWNSLYLTNDRSAILPIYFNNATDDLFICKCALKAYEKFGGIPEGAEVAEGICHLCQVKLNGKDHVVNLYGTEFLRNQTAFISQIEIINELDHRTAMADVARVFETSKWKTEALLYAIVRELFPNNTVLREYSPEFLNGLRIDIFVKEINLAIEYQGEQHFKPIELFGGIASHKELIVRDKKKKDLCLINGLSIEYFTYKEKIIFDNVQKKLKRYMEKG